MIKKQSSLLNFFQKAPAPNGTQSTQATSSFQSKSQNGGSGKSSAIKEDSSQSIELKRVRKSSPAFKDDELPQSQQSQSSEKSVSFLEQFRKMADSKSQAIQPKKGVSKKTPPSLKQVKKSNTSMQEEEEVLIDVEKHEGEVLDYNDFTDRTPDWAMKENARDAKGRHSSDPNYDPTTLFVPPEELKKCTPTMKQYWQIKSQNYDKILLFKLGKFYELFFEDALICHRELDFKWMGTKMHVGFPEGALDRFAPELVNRGYKVCIVEQTETLKQMEERLKKSSKEEKTIKREMVQAMSKGTYVDPNDTNYEARILLSLRNNKSLISVAFLDIGFNKIHLGQFQDDENHTVFKTFISQIRPTEVIYETVEVGPELIRVLKNCSSQPVFSPVNDSRAWNQIHAYGQLEKHYGYPENWPEGLRGIFESKEKDLFKDQVLGCLAGMVSYLEKMLILDNVISTARYEIYDMNNWKQTRMVLDSQALQHLEILEVEYSTRNRTEGSLLSYIDKTVSKYGKRLLRKWICAPLLSVALINDRLDAVEDLEKIFEKRNKFLNQLKALPDLERLCGKIYKLSVKKNENVVMFEDVSTAKLKEFQKVLDHLKKARELLRIFENCEFKSKILQRLTTFDDHHILLEGKSENMPDVQPMLEEISNFIRWQGQDKPGPKKGVDKDYDAAQQEIENIQGEFDKYLKEIQARFGNNRTICYAHSKKRYEIEVPSELVAGSKKPADFEFSSKRQGRERFVTKKTTQLVQHLEEVEEQIKQILSGFAYFLFGFFYNHHKVWDRFIEGLAQLDCLCSLSVTSFVSDGVMCRPDVVYPGIGPFMQVKNLRHPCISLFKANFIPNDVEIGNPRILLLTGPNMGGKSTILRQTCVATILAQLGCFVPAENCKLSIVDRIFTRIGASDKLMEGKSTFYIEMEETLNVLRYATKDSLVIMDELGRGTSTYDGLAIACSVLKHIAGDIRCRTLFATHYHVLLDEFRDDAKIAFYHMAARVEKEIEKITFLYKLIPGECSNSFGLNIAKVSGLPEVVLKSAKHKAQEFEEQCNLRENVQASKTLEKILPLLGQEIQNQDIENTFFEIEQALGRISKIG